MAHFSKDTIFSKRMPHKKLMMLPASFTVSLYLLHSFYLEVIQPRRNVNVACFQRTLQEDGLPFNVPHLKKAVSFFHDLQGLKTAFCKQDNTFSSLIVHFSMRLTFILIKINYCMTNPYLLQVKSKTKSSRAECKQQ